MTKSDEIVQPWMQQKGEQAKSFHLFTIYRDLGPTRTLEKIRQKQIKEDIGGNSTPLSTLTTLAAKWCWVDRCRSWDEHLDSVARTEEELAVKDMVKRHALLSKEMLESVFKLRNDPSFDGLSLTQKAWVLNSATHSLSKLALLERVSRGEPAEHTTKDGGGLTAFARIIKDSFEENRA